MTAAIPTHRILLAGEAMALFAASEEGQLSSAADFHESVAGAELNVAIGLKRLGQSPLYVTRLGSDVFAARIRQLIQRDGLSADGLLTDSHAATGFMLKSRVESGDPSTAYFRTGSAASHLSPDDIDRIPLDGVWAIHLTGVLPALSDSCRWFCRDLARLATAPALGNCSFPAPARGQYFLSFDPNLRPSLWPSHEVMIHELRRLCAQADLVLPGLGEAKQLVGTDDPEQAVRLFCQLGARAVVLKCGPSGAYVRDFDGIETWVPGFHVDHVLDTVGAGDGFAAGVLSALAEGKNLVQAAERGCAVGAIQTQSYSDNEGLPTQQQLADFIATHLHQRTPTALTASAMLVAPQIAQAVR
jgi:2-dehydro-3-deoxygluconokinase